MSKKLFYLLDKYNAQMERVVSPLDLTAPNYDEAFTVTVPYGKMPANVFAIDPQQVEENTRKPNTRRGKWHTGYLTE